MRKRYYILIAVIAYLVFLLTSIPANYAANIINSNTPVSIQGVSGTLWKGQAYVITINNTAQLDRTEWDFSLWKLLIGQLALDIETFYAGNKINTELGTSFLGRFFANDLTAKIPAQEVAKLTNIPLAQFSGMLFVNIESAHWKPGELPSAFGNINWNSAEITVADTASLGNVNITLGESEQQLLKADIKNQGGDINITGSAELVPEANYDVNITLVPTTTASNNIKQSLGMFAKKQTTGEFLLKKSGSLNQIGLM